MTPPTDLWPVLRRYSGTALHHVALPVGGIGTGSISLGGRGQLRDWELFNRPAKGHTPASFFCLRVSGAAGTHARVLESSLLEPELAGGAGSPTPLSGLPRFREGRFAAAYPFGQVTLSDPDLPVRATVGAFNPLVPGDADASGIPALVYRVRLENLSSEELRVDLAGNLQHVIGWTAQDGVPEGNVFDRLDGGGTTMLLGRSTRVPTTDPTWGTLALAVLDAPASSHRTTWARRSWGDSLLDFWDDFCEDGHLQEPPDGARVPTGSLVVTDRLEPGGSSETTFVVAWHVPHRRAWDHEGGTGPQVVGNHYADRFPDSAAVVRHVAAHLPALERRTREWVGTVLGSSLPPEAQDAVLSTTAVLASTTCLRIADGTFLGWEGSWADHGSCHGSCTHVWNYQYALEQLFPDLAWTMRSVELEWSLDPRGMMSFRAGLPLETDGAGWRVGAADGQMGALVRLHRTWLLTGDDARLARLWPAARRALEFAWVPGGWDADRDGLMEGCQHSTTDVEYYGPSGVNQSWYLAALAACVDLARAVGDTGFAATCAGLLRRGARLTDEVVFDGEYYAQRVLPPGSRGAIAEGLRLRSARPDADVGSDDLVDPDFQIGAGCTSDQLVGHTMATLSGLDTGLRPDHVRSALRAVARHNQRDDFHSHVNHLRTYAAGDDRGLVNASYPRGGRPARPFPYATEVWTGVEYTAAVGLALVGEHSLAHRIVRQVRERHDGTSRNPFDEVECGHHYVRSMAAFGLVHGWARTVVDARADTVTVDPVPGRWPVVVGERLGHVVVEDRDGEVRATYVVVSGAAFTQVRVRPRHLVD